MSSKEKLITRFLNRPKDFTYNELRTLLSYFGYEEDVSPNGSRVTFKNHNKGIIKLHKPHPGNIVKEYVLDLVRKKLEEEGLI